MLLWKFFEKFNSQEGRFPAFWRQIRARAVQAVALISDLDNHSSVTTRKTGPVVQGNCRAHLIHMVTKRKFGIETGDIFWTIYKRMKKESLTKKQVWLPEACESNVRACEREKKLLRHVTGLLPTSLSIHRLNSLPGPLPRSPLLL